jgi:hypothetical protein
MSVASSTVQTEHGGVQAVGATVKRRGCSGVVTERITMLPMKGVLDESLALDLVMDALRGKHEGGYVFAEFKGSERREPSSPAPRTRKARHLTIIDGGKGV